MARQRLIDDSHSPEFRVVRLLEQASFDQRQLYRLEVAGAGDTGIHLWRWFIRIQRAALDLKIDIKWTIGQPERIKWIGRSHGRREHPRQGLHAFNQSQAEIAVLLVRRV